MTTQSPFSGTRGGSHLRNCLAAILCSLAAATVSAADDKSAPTAVEEGREVAADRKRGNCYTCHWVAGAELAGNVAPPLINMKSRYPDRQVLYRQIADARTTNPDTVMPPFGAHGILTVQELNQVVDYVLSL